MWIVTDDGLDMIDAAKMAAFSHGTVTEGPERGTIVLLATAPGMQSIVVKGGDNRVRAGLRAIHEALEPDDPPRVLYMQKAVGVGDRPKATAGIAVPRIAVAPGFDPRGNGGRG